MAEWRPVPDYEGVYEVSDDGRIRSITRSVRYKNGSVRTIRGREMRPYSDQSNRRGSGYSRVQLSKNGSSDIKYVHRIVAAVFIDNPLNKPCVNHIDGNKSNNCVANLEWVTQSENMKHAFKYGLETPPVVKLSDQEAREIRIAKGTHREIADRYGVSRATVTAIKNNRIHKEMV